MMKKEGIVSLFSFVFTIYLIGLVSAQYDLANPRDFTESIVQGVGDIATPVFSALFGVYQSDEFLFVKILVFILLFLGIRLGVKAIPALGEQTGVVNIISLVVSLIAIRFLSESDLVRGILLPYGVLGVAVLTGLVFVLYFFFVEKTVSSAGGRKFLWFLFVLIMAVLWFSQRDKLSGVTNFIYWGALGLGILMFFFDKNVKRYFDRQANYATAVQAINRHLGQLYTDYNNAMNVPGDAGDRMRKDIMKQIKRLEEEKHKLS
ncbi:hypothetical protein HYW75_04250 [Candidatus Pacearchaeota archaeon]|nr:hypothetical protein [Candidatus Pacearchaeota archaeon]